ncbi:MAG TPA: hypothetical protein VJQ44_04285 [Gemmatimonadales bacterium]|nr:hypothetical protein [Gemmatimonadales bacterium]
MPASRLYRVRLCAVLLLAPVLGLPVAGCTRVTLISAYDEQVDHSASELQQRMDGFLTMLADKAGTPEASYEANRDFYSDYAVGIRAVRVRALAQPKNSITVQQLDLMSNSLEELRKAHQDAPISAEAVPAFRDLFNQAWGAIIRLELAKKRGEDG